MKPVRTTHVGKAFLLDEKDDFELTPHVHCSFVHIRMGIISLIFFIFSMCLSPECLLGWKSKIANTLTTLCRCPAPDKAVHVFAKIL